MKHTIRLRSFLALAGSALLTISHANAASGDWIYDGATAGSLLWSSASSWNPAAVPGTAAGDVVTFINNITANRTITIDTATTRTVGSLTIGDSNNTHGFTIARAGTGNLVFEASSGNAQLVENGSVNDTITTTFTLNSNLDITANGSLTLGPTNGGIIATNKTITKLGVGSLTITGNHGANLGSTNNFNVQAGTLIYNNANALGSAAVNLNGGNLDAASVQNGVTANAAVHGWNADWAWGGTASFFSLGSGAVTLGASTVQVTVTQNQLTVGGAIGDTGAGRGLTKAGIGTLVLGAANTYTGTTTVTGGVLRLADDSSLAGGNGASGGLSALTINGGVVELSANDFARDLGNTASTFQITGGTSGFSSVGSGHTITINNNAGQEVQWGSTYFAPGTLVLNDTTANAGLEFRNGLDLNAADRTINVNTNTAVVSGDIRTTSGTAGLIKGGAGTLELTGTNTYNGSTTVNAGVLSVGSTSNLPGDVVFNGGTVRVAVGGSGWTTGQVDTLLTNATKTSGAIGLNTSSGNLTQWTGFTGGGNFGALGLEKSGSNTLTLNQANSYTGATTISGGTLRMLNPGGTSSQSLTGGLTINGPDVTLMSDNAGGTWTTSFGTTAPTRNTGSTLNIVTTGAGSSVVNLGGAAGFVNNGIFFNGTDYAWLDTANGQVRVADYGVDTGTSAANALTASTHALMTSDQTFNPGGNRTLTSLKITGGADLTFTANARLLTNSILVSGGDSVITLGGAQLGAASGSFDMIIRVEGSSDKLTIPATVNNPAGVNMVKSGAGTLVAAGNLAQTGNLYVNGGTMELQGTLAAPIVDISTGATLVFNSSAAQSFFGGTLTTGTISGGGDLVKNGTGTLTISSPTSFTGTTTVLGGIVQLSNSYALSGSTLDTANSVAGTGSVGLRISNGISNLTLGGLSGDKNFASTGGVFSTTNGNYGNITALTLNPGAGASPSYSGEIADGASGMSLTKTGNGTQILSGTNTYTGATTVSAGTLLINGDNTAATGAVTVASGATLGGTGGVGGNTTIQSGGIHAPGVAEANQDFAANLTYSSGSIFSWEIETVSTNYDSVTGTGAGALTGAGAVFNITSSTAYSDTFWNTNQTWTDIFSGFNTSGDWDDMFTSITGDGLVWSGSQADAGAEGYFTLSAGSLDWTAAVIPEPTSALAGLLLGAGLLRRRRTA